MDLSKTSVIKLLIFATATFFVSIVAIGLLGLSLERYWSYYFSIESETARLQMLQKEVSGLESVLSERRRDVATIPEKWDEFSLLTNSLMAARLRHEGFVASVDSVRKELDVSRQALSESASKLSATNTLLHERAQALVDCEAKVQELIRTKGELEGVGAAIISSRQSLTNLSAEISKLMTQRDRLVAKIETLEQTEVDLQSRVQSERERMRAIATENAASVQAYAVTNSLIIGLEERLATVKRDIVAAQARQKELQGVEGDVVARRKELELAEAAIEAARSKKETIEGQLATVQQKIADARSVLSGVEEKSKAEKRTFEALKADVAAVEARKAKLQAELSEIELSFGVKSPKEKRLVERLSALAGEYIAATNELAVVREKVRTEIREAQADLDAQLAVKEENVAKRLERAGAAQKAADEKAEKIVRDAKETAAAVEAAAAADKKASEIAQKAKLDAEMRAQTAQQEEMSARSRIVELKKEIEVLSLRANSLRNVVETNRVTTAEK